MIDLTRALAVPGWMTLRELQWLAERATAAQTVIEVGSWKGRSTRALADHCPGIVYAIDSWDGPCYKESGAVHPIDTRVWPDFKRHLQDHLLTGRVRVLRTSSARALQDFATAGLKADLMFIDGDHRYASCVADLAAAWPVVRSGGLLAGHDYGHPEWPGVARAVDEHFGPPAETVDSIWWVQKP